MIAFRRSKQLLMSNIRLISSTVEVPDLNTMCKNVLDRYQWHRETNTFISGTAVVNDEDIQSVVVESRELLEKSGRTDTMAIESFALENLIAMHRIKTGKREVTGMTFVCIHNAGRSQISAAWARHLSGGK